MRWCIRQVARIDNLITESSGCAFLPPIDALGSTKFLALIREIAAKIKITLESITAVFKSDTSAVESELAVRDPPPCRICRRC